MKRICDRKTANDLAMKSREGGCPSFEIMFFHNGSSMFFIYSPIKFLLNQFVSK